MSRVARREDCPDLCFLRRVILRAASVILIKNESIRVVRIVLKKGEKLINGEKDLFIAIAVFLKFYISLI